MLKEGVRMMLRRQAAGGIPLALLKVLEKCA
jgi:hypothetical protein